VGDDIAEDARVYHRGVFWLQGGLCFFIWIAYGVIQTRRSKEIRTWAKSIPQARRGLLAAAVMLGAVVLIFAVLNIALLYNGFGAHGMTIPTWIGVACFGLAFVHGQTLATALLVTSAQESVTAGRIEASSTQGIRENDDHEASS